MFKARLAAHRSRRTTSSQVLQCFCTERLACRVTSKPRAPWHGNAGRFASGPRHIALPRRAAFVAHFWLQYFGPAFFGLHAVPRFLPPRDQLAMAFEPRHSRLHVVIFELGLVCCSDVVGMSIVWSTCFDRVPQGVAFKLDERQGIHLRVQQPQRGMYTSLSWQAMW